jgi:uncharacterized lipoprotein YmbA
MRLPLHSREEGKVFEMTARSFAVLGLLSSVLCLPGCSLPEAQADPTRFFVLSTPAATATGSIVTTAPAVHVRQIELASYIRSRPLIVRKSENEVEFREFARWGEPLEQGIARVLREELLARGAASAVVISGVRATNRPYDFELTIRVLACEGTADGNVIFRAVWELAGAAGGKNAPSVARGDFHPEDLKWDGKSETSLVAALSKAVAGLAGEIAGGMKQ